LSIAKGYIQDVIPDSPAQHANLSRGDKLISANGVSLIGMSDAQLMPYMHGPIGTSIDLVIERGGKRFACRVVRGEVTEQDRGLPTKIGTTTPSTVSSSSTTKLGANLAATAAKKKITSPLPISFKRRTADSEAVNESVLSALDSIPRALVDDVAGAGVKILITPTIPDAFNNSSGDRPRGYIHGGGYDNCPALYSHREHTIYIAERTSRGNAPPSRNGAIAPTLLHEFGHALDHVRNISSSPEFAATYKTDCDKLSNSQRTRYYYFTQTEDAGPSELFAELFAAGVSNKAGQSIRSSNMPSAFPQSFAIIQRLL
jgi:hypothetical protein